MTKKDYELIAEAIRDAAQELAAMPGKARTANAIAHDIGETFGVHLRGTNARFDSDRFVAACTKDL